MPPCPHLIDFTGTFTWTFFSAFGGATATCDAAAGSISTAASRVVALQLQPCRLDVPSIHSLLSGDTATRAVSWAPPPEAAATSVMSATPANEVFFILPPSNLDGVPRRSACGPPIELPRRSAFGLRPSVGRRKEDWWGSGLLNS